MRTLVRNKKPIYYSLFDKKEEVLDEYDNPTGEYTVSYGDPLPFKISISAARGYSETRQFGDTEDYDRVMVTHDLSCPIDTDSLLWVDDLDTENPHDYIVTKKAPSLNAILYAIKKVSVGA